MNNRNLSTLIFTKVYNSLNIEQCYVCGFKGEGNLCSQCRTFLTPNTHHCGQCARPTLVSIDICGQCQSHPPAFKSVIAPMVYSGLTRALITQAKFNNKGHLFRPLAKLLAHALLKQLDLSKPWHWCVVPTGRSSLLERGYCQTRFIRKLLKSHLKHTLEHPFHTFDISRSQERPTQHTLKKKERHRLSAKAFTVAKPAPDYVILIDDLITTGSTIEACAKALKQAGSKEVIVVALARTPPQTSEPL